MTRAFPIVCLAALVLSATGLQAQEALPLPGGAGAAEATWMPSLTASQHTKVTEQNELIGRLRYFDADGGLRALPNVSVTVVSMGRLVSTAKTDAEGSFALRDVQRGIYTLVASETQALLVLPIMVDGAGADAQPIELYAASSVPAADRQRMLSMVQLPRDDRYAPLAPNAWPAVRSSAPQARVTLSPDGSLQGKMSIIGRPFESVDLRGMQVAYLRGGRVLGAIPVTAEGDFSIANMTAGPLSLVCFGPQGFAALGVEVLPAAARGAQVVAEGHTYVAMQGGGSGLEIEIAPSVDVVVASEVTGDNFNRPLPPGAGPPPFPGGAGGGLAGGGGAGGGIGGGGGGSGGGGLGGLLGAAGLAAVALASDDDDAPFIPPAASPAM